MTLQKLPEGISAGYRFENSPWGNVSKSLPLAREIRPYGQSWTAYFICLREKVLARLF
jgi:hypothetical protein